MEYTDLYIHTYTMAARIPTALTKVTHPAILPISPRTFGNNVPKSLHKTRRSWWPNVTRANLTVSILDGQPMGATLKGKEREILGAVPRTQALKGVKIAVRDLKDVDKAGGVEGLLVCPADASNSVHS
jgi:large subunit ribosomal protein L28